MSQQKQAFTLIELLVVVLITGILVAVAVPQYQNAVQRSQYATIKNLTKSVANAQEVFYLANGEYADNFEKLDITLSGYNEDKSTEAKLVFPWGNCETGATGQILCYYRFPDFGVQYQIACAHSTANVNGVSTAGKTRCIGDGDDNSKRSHLCQRETGKTGPDLRGGGYTVYFF